MSFTFAFTAFERLFELETVSGNNNWRNEGKSVIFAKKLQDDFPIIFFILYFLHHLVTAMLKTHKICL